MRGKMTEREHLLACLAEEAGEIIIACSKALRFGEDDQSSSKERTNRGDIEVEIVHLIAVAEMLGLRSQDQGERVIIQTKKLKVIEFMDYAGKRGTLLRERERGVQ